MLKNKFWGEENLSDQGAKVALITGANSGLGFENARALASKGATVILACRCETKAMAAMDAIKALHPTANLEFLPMDLSSLASIKTAADRIKRKHKALDILINNAGVMMLPESQTADGLEMQLGTNHLGHYALTGHLLELITDTPDSRIVTVSSMAHLAGSIHFDDINLEKSYGRFKAYGQSKLANLLFTYELKRKLAAVGSGTLSVAAHPGMSATNLTLPMFEQGSSSVLTALVKKAQPLAGQSPKRGALPQLLAATAPTVRSGDFYGPLFFQQIGPPKKARSNARSYDKYIAQRLWDLSAELTGVKYSFPKLARATHV